MKTNQKYLAIALIAVFTVTGMSLGTLGSAQTVTPVGCSVNVSSVGVNQVATLTATGGNGSYIWSGQNLNITNSAGTQFAVSYPSVGTRWVTVTSAGQSATCNVNVVAAASTGNLVCAPAVQNVMLGQTATFTVTGGNGSYFWTAPDLTIANPTGSGFSANYASAGLKTLTVTSAGLVATCATNVLTSGTPGFPNTGVYDGE
jgi:hypothetical protein